VVVIATSTLNKTKKKKNKKKKKKKTTTTGAKSTCCSYFSSCIVGCYRQVLTDSISTPFFPTLFFKKDLARCAVDLFRRRATDLQDEQDASILLYEAETYQLLQKYAAELRAVDLGAVSVQTRPLFFINLYQALFLHATILSDADLSAKDAGKQRAQLLKHCQYEVDGRLFSLLDIEFGVVRLPGAAPKKTSLFARSKAPPRSEFALDHGNVVSCLLPTLTADGPPLMVYTDIAQLNAVANDYLTRNVRPDVQRGVVTVPHELEGLADELGSADFVQFVLRHVSEVVLHGKLSALVGGAKIELQPADWSLRVVVSKLHSESRTTQDVTLVDENAYDAPPLPAAAGDTGGVPTSANGGVVAGGGFASKLRGLATPGKQAGAAATGGSPGGANNNGGGSSSSSSHSSGASSAGSGAAADEHHHISDSSLPADTVATEELTGRAQNVLGKHSADKPHLILKHMQLTALPAEVLQFPNIEVLDVRSNHIVTLPDAVGRLTALRTLRIANNTCSELPHTLTLLHGLSELDIGQNDFGKFGLSPAIANLTSLRHLLLQWNALERLPDSIGSMSNLRWLDAAINRMAELPDSFAALDELEQLELSHNSFTALPPSVLRMTSLVRLELIGNELEDLPAAIGALDGLTRLDLRLNHLAGLPKQFVQLTGLRALFLDHNELTKLPKLITKLASVREAWLGVNKLTKLPAFGATMTALEELHAWKNQLTELPNSLGDCPTLYQLDVSDNRLTALPASLGRLTQLHRLIVARNSIAELPDSLGQCAGMQELFAFQNRLESLPPTLGRLSRLQFLQLNSNRIAELDGETLGAMRALTTLQLACNRLRALPRLGERLTALTDLNLFGNEFAELPEALAALDQLKTLNLGRNRLSGAQRWHVLDALKSLTALHLDDNSLPKLPAPVLGLERLTYLSLSCNRIEALPPGITRLQQLTVLFVNNNRLAALPDPLPSPATLREANFAYNRITAAPASLALHTALADLDLCGNRLTEPLAAFAAAVPGCDLKLLGNALTQLERPPNWVAGTTPREPKRALTAKSDFRARLVSDAPSPESSTVSDSDTVPNELQVRVTLADSMPRRGTTLTVTVDDKIDAVIERANVQFGVDATKRRGFLFVRSKRSNEYVASLADADVPLFDALRLVNARDFDVVLASVGTVKDIAVAAPAPAAEAPTSARQAPPVPPVPGEPYVESELSAEYASRALVRSAFSIGWAEMQGRRPEQQDHLQVVRQATNEGDDELYVGVFDGHTGTETSLLCANKLHVYLADVLAQSREDKGARIKSDGAAGNYLVSAASTFSKSENRANRRIAAALRRAFALVHVDTVNLPLPDGSAALVALLIDRRVFLANTGDCRAVLFDVDSQAIVCSTSDHKPESASEIARIKGEGGFVSDKGRVNGVLSLSRAIGDVALQPVVSWEPEITVVQLQPQHRYRLLMGCDGVFDVCASSELPSAMRGLHIGAGNVVEGAWHASLAAARLRDFAYAVDSRDNLSVVCVDILV
jgi:Leucine-rich repeat (LRR) protein/serine/threonine protein phosphatase PrpC